jgi:hypothetical protein
MALTHNEYYDLMRTIRLAQFHTRIGVTTADLQQLEKLQEELASHRTLPKKGDLVIDHEWPTDGLGIVLEIRDRRKKNPYKLATHLGTDWFSKEYVEYQCRIVS